MCWILLYEQTPSPDSSLIDPAPRPTIAMVSAAAPMSSGRRKGEKDSVVPDKKAGVQAFPGITRMPQLQVRRVLGCESADWCEGWAGSLGLAEHGWASQLTSHRSGSLLQFTSADFFTISATLKGGSPHQLTSPNGIASMSAERLNCPAGNYGRDLPPSQQLGQGLRRRRSSQKQSVGHRRDIGRLKLGVL